MIGSSIIRKCPIWCLFQNHPTFVPGHRVHLSKTWPHLNFSHPSSPPSLLLPISCWHGVCFILSLPKPPVPLSFLLSRSCSHLLLVPPTPLLISSRPVHRLSPYFSCPALVHTLFFPPLYLPLFSVVQCLSTPCPPSFPLRWPLVGLAGHQSWTSIDFCFSWFIVRFI